MSINEDSDIDNKRIVNYIVVAVLVVALLALQLVQFEEISVFQQRDD